jgi:hypothetical protein
MVSTRLGEALPQPKYIELKRLSSRSRLHILFSETLDGQTIERVRNQLLCITGVQRVDSSDNGIAFAVLLMSGSEPCMVINRIRNVFRPMFPFSGTGVIRSMPSKHEGHKAFYIVVDLQGTNRSEQDLLESVGTSRQDVPLTEIIAIDLPRKQFAQKLGDNRLEIRLLVPDDRCAVFSVVWLMRQVTMAMGIWLTAYKEQ